MDRQDTKKAAGTIRHPTLQIRGCKAYSESSVGTLEERPPIVWCFVHGYLVVTHSKC
jgi:hypothetical protein